MVCDVLDSNEETTCGFGNILKTTKYLNSSCNFFLVVQSGNLKETKDEIHERETINFRKYINLYPNFG